MPKDEWGAKRLCPSCSTRFYDLGSDPMTCPACGAEFTLESLTAGKSKPPRPEKAKPEAGPAEPEEVAVIEEDETELSGDDDIDDDVLEDDDENVDLEDIADVPADDDES